MKVEFYKHSLGDDEKKAVLECLDGLFLTTGSYVDEFENLFAGYLNLRYAVGLNSCTAALHLSLLAMGIGEGDEVITTPMTFIATATAIMHTGALPIFIDVEPDTGLMDPSKIEASITDRTKAILPVHLYGQMCDMLEIKQIADKNNLKIIEDAAHCVEGERDSVRPGHLSDVACFSFYATKNLTSGEGGAIATNDKRISKKIRSLRQHGMSKEAAERYSGNYQHWNMYECGWKYNMDNIHASLLIPQVKNIEDKWKKRYALYRNYIRALKDISDLRYPEIPANSKSAFHLFTIWVEPSKRDLILMALGKQGIGVAVNYRAIHLLKYFSDRFQFTRGTFPNAEKIGDATISLPFYPGLTQTELKYVVQTLKQVL